MPASRDVGKGGRQRPKSQVPPAKKGAAPSQTKDVKSASDRARGAAGRETKAYRKAVRAAYDSKPPAARKKRAESITVAASPNDRVIAKTHGERKTRRREKDAKSDREFLPAARSEAQQILRRIVREQRNLPTLQDTKRRELNVEKVARGEKSEGPVKALLGNPNDPAGTLAKGLTGAGTSAAAIAEATYHDPIGVPVKTAKSLPTVVAGIPAGVYETGRHPNKAFAQMEKSVGTSYKEKVKRIREKGAVEDLGNVALVAGPASGSAGRLLAAKGKLPPRAAKLQSGGVRKTPKTRGLVSYGVGRSVDAVKARRLERKARKDKPLRPLDREALLANRAAGRTVAVLPVNSKAVTRRQGVAKPRGKAHYALRRALSKGDFGKMQGELARLSKDEQKALWFAAEPGIRTPEVARVELPKLRAMMVEGRGDTAPRGHEKRNDVVKLIDEVLEAPEKYFTPRLHEVLERVRPLAEAVSKAEPKYALQTKEARRRAVQRQMLDIEPGEAPAKLKLTAKEVAAIQRGEADVPAPRYDPETPEAFNARLDAAAKERGLASPLYFKSEKQRAGLPDFASMTVGGLKARSVGKPYQGLNLTKGIFDTSKKQFERGYARNVSDLHNWRLVSTLTKKNNLDSITPEPEGITIGEGLNRVNRAEPLLDRGEVGWINPGLFEKHMNTADTDPNAPVGDLIARTNTDLDSDDWHGGSAALSPRQLEALQEAAMAGDEAAILLTKSPGWHAVPMEALRELEAEMKSGTRPGRVADVVKGKLSQAILLTGNLPWLGFQTVSETAMTGLSTKGRALTPRNMAGTARWWKALDDEGREQVGMAAGLGTGTMDTHSVRLGSAVNNGFVNWYRGMKDARFWHRPIAGKGPSISQLNPTSLMRAADAGKTNVLRLLALHSNLTKKQQAVVADTAAGMAKHDKAVQRLLPVFGKPAQEQLDHLAKHPELLEDAAESLVDYLGDWTTMTAAERKIANRFVMFWPFVRYSIRLVFYTLPVKHPAVTALLGELSQFTVEEYREIFGSDDLPWNIGKVYFNEAGNSTAIDLKRAHPGMNALMDALVNPSQGQKVAGMLPPYIGWIADQVFTKSFYKDKPFRVAGSPEWMMKFNQIGLEGRARIAANSVLSLMYPYRQASADVRPMGDDTLAWDKRPLKYKVTKDKLKARELAIHKAREQHEAEQKGLGSLILGPLMPVEDRSAKWGAELREVAKAKDARVAANKKQKPRGKPFKSSSGRGPFRSGGNKSPFRSN